MSAAFQFVPETHTYLLEGRAVPSVTQSLDGSGLVCYDHIPPDVLARKTEIGTAAHAACHYFDEGDLDTSTIDPAIEGYVRAWHRFRAETDFAPRLLELRGIANIQGMPYGYTLDREGTFRGHDTIIEIKCTAAVEISWGPQTAAYELARRTEDGIARRRIAVHLKPNGSYSLVPFNDANDYKVFVWALSLETWKRSKGKGNGN
jgi:hypothetical protein